MIDERYRLMETPEVDSLQRTEWNVRDSDGTLILSIGEKLSGGSAETRDFALKHGKPYLHLSRAGDGEKAPSRLSEFVAANRIATLNVAGPRASEEPQVSEFVRSTLLAVLSG